MASLHHAVECGDVEEVEKLLSSGEYQVNCTDSEGRTPLHIACGEGYLDLVRVLVSHGADFTAKDKNNDTPLLAAGNFKYDCILVIIKSFDCHVTRGTFGRTLLHFACANGDIDLLHILVQNCNADLNVKNDFNDTPVMIAAKNVQYEIWKSLVCNHGCDANVQDPNGNSLLHIACADGNTDLVHMLVRDCKADLSIRDYYNYTPLMTAAIYDQYKVWKLLVCDYGCDPNARGHSGESLLHIACADGDEDLVDMLVRDCMADLNIVDDYDYTPLMTAVGNHQCKIVKSLVCFYGCYPNVTYPNGESLLHIACANGEVELVHVLIQDCKADLDIKNDFCDTPFIIAAQNNNCEVVKSLVCDYGCDPNVTDPNGRSLLHIACANGNIELVHVLIQDCKADLGIKNDFGDTPLMVAAKNNNFEVVKSLVCDYGCDPNVTDPKGRSLLHIACANDYVDLIHVLIRDLKADPDIKDGLRYTPLMIAARNNKYELAKSLVCDYGCDANVTDFLGRPLLHIACADGNTDLMHVLIRDLKADLDLRDSIDDTPLLTAARNKKNEVVKSLVCDYGCDPNITDIFGRTLLHITCVDGNIDLMHVLIQDLKADLDIRDNSGNTPLMTATKYNQYQAWKSLICDYGCDPNVRDSAGSTLLHIACADGNIDLMHVLIQDFKADLDIRDNSGNTPLKTAAKYNQYQVWKSLICDYGCDPNVRDFAGRTLLHIACADGNIDLVHVLVRDCKADLNIRDVNYITPLMTAARNSKQTVVKMLVRIYGCDPNIRYSHGKSLLHIACTDGSIDLVHVLVRDCKADLNIRDDNDNTPLMIAAENKDYKIWKSLVCDYGCDPNVRNSTGKSLLHRACADGDTDLVHVLMRDHKADITIVDDHNYTPLLTAVDNNQCKIVQSLVCDYGCDTKVKGSNGESLLHIACANGNIDMLHVIVKDCKADISIRDDQNNTPLMVAARYAHYEVCKSLVCDYGCDLRHTKGGKSLLHMACADGSIDLVHVLVRDCKADLNIRDDNDNTPLTIAAENNDYEIWKSLVCDYGCDPNVRNSTGKSLLHHVCADGNIDLVHVLVRDCKADLNIKDNQNDTPLMIAARNSRCKLVKILVCIYGCDPNVRYSSGKSLLHMACADGNVDLVHVLLQDCNADLNIRDDDNNTPLMTAVASNQGNIWELLVLLYNCDPDIRDSHGRTLLHYACGLGNTCLVQTLIDDHKADLNIRNNSDRKPLMSAVQHSQLEVVQLLIDGYNSDPNVTDSHGNSLLHIACATGNFEMVAYMYSRCSYYNSQNNCNDTPLMTAVKNDKYDLVYSLVRKFGCDYKFMLHYACANGDIKLLHIFLKFLKDCDADLNLRDDFYNTPLITAVNNNQFTAILVLFYYGCDPNIGDNQGRSPLHFACANGNIDIVHVLVKNCKADLNIRDDHDNTPLITAVRSNQHEVVKSLLYDYDCDPNIRGTEGKSLLHFVCIDGNAKSVQFLIQTCAADLDSEDDFKDTPLMTAVKNNNYEVVKVLISKYNGDIGTINFNKQSLLHMVGGIVVLKLLIEEYKMSPLITDNDGNSPLHVFSSGDQSFHLKCAEMLIFNFHAPVYIHNKEGKTPKDLAKTAEMQSLFIQYLTDYGQEIQAAYKSMQLLAAKRYFGSNFIIRLFVVGHVGAGKSSLVETLKREGLIKSFSRVSEKLVPPHTAGIVPSIFNSDSYGRVQFYDFAGDPEYYSSHAAILERLFQSNIGTNTCILVLNLLEDAVKIEEKYLFWLSFINYSFRKLEERPSVLIIGSHSDRLPSNREVSRKEKFIRDLLSKHKRGSVYLSLDCCNPRSSNIRLLRQSIHELAKKSKPYSLSLEESILLGLLEKDFSNVTACTTQTVTNHIQELKISLPRSVSLLYPILQQLQAIGVLLLVGGKEEDCYIILNVAQLTNEVHKKLFSENAFSINPNLASFNIGLLPESLLQEVLPKYITKECLIQLQYCQEISHIEVDSDSFVSPSLDSSDNSTSFDKSYLFFPALCNLDKKNISWQTCVEHGYSIGWLARCRNPQDYFPQRFLHVVLLRIALRFTLVACGEVDHQQLKRRCKMWKTGVHWLSGEGECEVDVIGSKEVVVSLHCTEESKMSLTAFNNIVGCVMEAKIEFCDLIVLDFFLLDKVGCLTDDNLFLVEDVERMLSEGKPSAVSVSGNKLLSSSKLIHISSSFWSSLFQIDEHSVLKYIESSIVKEWFQLGLNLDLHSSILKAIEANHPKDVIRCKTEMVITWLNSSSLTHPPCWWSLVKALHETEKIVCAENITKDKCEAMLLQEKLLMPKNSDLTPDEEFLESFSGVVGSKWSYLASLLSLSSSTIEEVRREGEGLTQRERALLMLHKWVSKEEATYGQLYQKLKPVSLFQYGK